eukprot:6147980-Amphidinium_carterae.1
MRHGKTKDRLITDLRKANLLSSRSERVVLPRPLDHARCLGRMQSKWGSSAVLVLDFADAYHTVPLHRDEQRFCAAE